MTRVINGWIILRQKSSLWPFRNYFLTKHDGTLVLEGRKEFFPCPAEEIYDKIMLCKYGIATYRRVCTCSFQV